MYSDHGYYSKDKPFAHLILTFSFYFESRALTTFRKETDEGEELELHSFEVAALMNLVATDMSVEEATTLIPSLSRFPQASMDEILDLIRSTMIRIVS
jgi:DNA-directed RNA polymerase II subunit RPB4